MTDVVSFCYYAGFNAETVENITVETLLPKHSGTAWNSYNTV